MNKNIDNFYMYRAIKESEKSNDKDTKVGCIIVKECMIMSEGHNTHMSKELPTKKEGELYDSKYGYTLHAEIDALLKIDKHLSNNSTAYVTLFPCHNCMCALITAGVKKVVYMCDKYADKDFTIAAKRLAEVCDIELVQMGNPINDMLDRVMSTLDKDKLNGLYKIPVEDYNDELAILPEVIKRIREQGFVTQFDSKGDYFELSITNNLV